MREEPRQGFLERVVGNDFIRAKDALVIGLLIPSGMLNELIRSEEEQDLIILEGAKILSGLNEGSFARVSWTTYWGLSKGEPENTRMEIKKAIELSSLVDKNYGLWQVVVGRLGNYAADKLLDELTMPIEKAYRSTRKP
jgi:hypothetical protein